MKIINIKFVDFWPEFDVNNNIFLNYLSKNFFVRVSDNPDYVIYSVFGHEYLHYDCIRIFYTCENIRPDFNLCDYAIAFDWMEFEDRYLRFPLYMLYSLDLEKAKVKHNISEEELSQKQKFCNFIYSNRNAHPARKDFFQLLNTYKKVDSGGRYLNNLGYCVKDKCEFQRQYKFSIAFENSSTSGYTTEKIIQAFAAKTVPIYWGNPMIAKEFNTKSFINCHEYDSFDDVLKKVIEIDRNDELYLNMLAAPIYENINPANIPNMKLLEDFLDNIFTQDISKAPRRAKSLNAAYYEKLQLLLLHSNKGAKRT